MDVVDRIRDVLKAEAQAIESVEVSDAYGDAVHMLRECRGKVITAGMGKAGIIAKKFAATLCSTGTPAVYVHPGEAAHGDLGIIAEHDCLIVFSTSGKTRELLEMLEMSRHLPERSTKVIGVTSHLESPLRQLCDLILEMGVIKEPCSLDLTPSASMAVMNAIADALALALMDLKGFTKHDYGLRHHGGYLGRKARLDNE